MPKRYSWDDIVCYQLFKKRHKPAWNDDIECDFLFVEYAG